MSRGDGLPHYPRASDVESACGCLVIMGLLSLVFWGVIWWFFGPVVTIALAMIQFAIVGLILENGPTGGIA